MVFHCRKAKLCCGVQTRTECHPWVENDRFSLSLLWRVPGRQDQQFLADGNGFVVFLPKNAPILLFDETVCWGGEGLDLTQMPQSMVDAFSFGLDRIDDL